MPATKSKQPHPLAAKLAVVTQELEKSVGAEVRETHLAFKGEFHDRLRQHRITSAQWVFLRVLWAQDGLNQKEVAQRVHVHPTTTVAALDVLAKHGYLRRQTSETDRRQSLVFLTDKGRDLALELLPFAAEINRRATQGISERELKQLSATLAKLRANLGY